ncbi:MAG TPA: hypothetical protein P5027_00155 [Flavobacteriales bacterium]|nr:hypothetical protein [Flavobacteriales bacterium]
MDRKRSSLSVLAAAILFSGCYKPPAGPGPGQLELTIIADWEGQPFATNTEYHNVNDYRVFVDQVRAYLSEMRLVSATDTAELLDIDLVDLGGGPVTYSFTVPGGTYTHLLTGIGIPEDLNNSDPAQYPQGHPLSLSNGTYWTWTTGYRFIIFDGRYDTDPNGTGNVLPTFSIHAGLDTCYTFAEVQSLLPITIMEGVTHQATLRVHVDRFFHSGTDTLDLAIDNQFHGGSNVDVALRLMEHVKHALELE